MIHRAQEDPAMSNELKKFRVTFSWAIWKSKSAVIEARDAKEAEEIAELSDEDDDWEFIDYEDMAVDDLDLTEVEEIPDGESVKTFIPWKPEDDSAVSVGT